METTLSKIIAAKGHTLVSELTVPGSEAAKRGKIIVRADVITRNNDDVTMRVKASLFPMTTMGCCSDINNPYYIISRARPDNTKEFVRVFESEYLVDTTNPIFAKRRLKMALICNANVELPIKISFYSNI